jgi:hypothetical protein
LARTLLDQNVPHGVRALLPGHETVTAVHLGWERLQNGDLIANAEQAGSEVLITADKNLRYQRTLDNRQLAVVVLSSTRWALLKAHGPAIIAAVEGCAIGSFVELPPLLEPPGAGRVRTPRSR